VASLPTAEQVAEVSLAVEPLADMPLLTAMATRPADGSLYFTSQTGEAWRVADGGSPMLVLDLRASVSPYENGSERGLLGITFGPLDGRLFLYYTDAQFQSHLDSYAVGSDGRPDPASRWIVMEVEQPGVGHKGGGMSFDDDGTLYLALGDGGGSSGRDAQDYSKILGAIVRIVPRVDGQGYDLPADNPYLGDATKRPEIWAKGLRNPWGFWRDPATGHLWTGDVGEATIEELNRIPAGVAGANLGWYFLEGNEFRYDGAPPDALAPIFAYRHDELGPAVIGGRIYRGSAIPKLVGAYVFADMSGPVLAMAAGDVPVRTGLLRSGIVTAFGEDAEGELIMLTLTEGAFRVVPG